MTIKSQTLDPKQRRKMASALKFARTLCRFAQPSGRERLGAVGDRRWSEASDLTCDREKKVKMLDGRYTFDIWKIMGHTICIYIYTWVIHGK